MTLPRGSLFASMRSRPLSGFGNVGQVPYVPLPTPEDIFGVNLTAWWDASEGVVTGAGTGVDRVTSWTDKISGHVASGADSTLRPLLITDTDGLPSLKFEPTYLQTLTFGSTPFIGNISTVYVFCVADNTPGQKTLLVGLTSNTLLFAHSGYPSSAVLRPGTYRPGGYHIPAHTDVIDWSLMRFSQKWVGADSPQNHAIVAINDEADSVATGISWSGLNGHYWGTISHSYAGGSNFEGRIKDIVMLDRYVEQTDPEHAAMLAYFAERYPTLVTY